MAILSNLLVNGESRLLGKLYTNDVDIGNDLTVVNQVTANRLHIETDYNPSNLTTSNSDSAPFTVGKKTGRHIAIDADEIASKANATTSTTLYLNYSGGTVYLSNGTAIYASNGTFHATNFTGSNVGTSSSYITNAYVTTAAITTANTNTINNATNIYNKNGTIETDVIKSNKWEIVSTQNLGGDFFVAPTIMVTNGSTFTISSVSGNTITGTLKDTTNITSANFGGHTWSANSLIKITGKLTTGSTHYILGTCDGKLTAQMNNTANTINFQITCNASTVPPAGTYTITDGTVMMYNVGGSNKVGIYMTCYGTDKYTYIDIYNGSNGNTPVARLGKLDNLKDGSGNRIKVGDALTTDYGIYTKNGFFEGKVVANGGTIAGWTIGDGYITTNSDRTTYDNTSYTGMTMTASGIGARGSATSYFNLSTGGGLTAVGATVTGVITANTGYIGGTSGWTIAAQQLYSGTIGADNSLHLGTKNLGNNTSIGSRQGSDWRLTVGQHFGVTNTGALYCNDIHAVGGDIAGWRIESSYLANGTATAPAANVLLLSPNGTSSSYTIAGQAKTGWMITAGTTFGVNKDGGVYATGGKIGGFNITTNAIYSTTNALGTTANNVYVGTEGISLGTTFKVTKAGVLNATDATITGDITAESFSALDSNSKERATVNTNGFIVKDASGNTVATLSNDLTLGQVVANRYNVFIDADVGIQNRKNTSVLSQFDSTSIKFYDGSGTAAANITAQFLSTGATIGKTSTNHVLLDSSGMKVKNGGTVLADFGSTITLGQTTGQAAVIDGNGMQIYKGGTKVAEFGGNEITIGKTTGGHIILDSDSMDIYKNNNTKIAEFGDTIKLGTGKNRTEVSPGDLSMYYLHDYVPPISLYITHAPFDSEGNAGNIRPEISLSGFDVDDNLEVDGEITECYITPYFVRCNKFMNNSDDSIYQLYKGNNSSPFYIYGNNKIITRIATKTSSVDNPSTSFMIGNGYYAAGSDSSGNIVNNNINMYLCGGTDSTSKYIQSYPVYNRTYNYGANMYITVNGVLGRSTSSSIRYKHDVEYYTNKDNSTINESEILVTKKKAKENPESILGIPIVTFKYNEGYVNGEADFDYNKPILGLIAEDVAKICPECATYIEDDDGNKIPEAWDEKALLVRLLYVVQKQNKMIEELQKEVQKWQ